MSRSASAWALLAPALLLTGLLLAGVALLADTSLHPLDRSTFRPSETWSAASYLAVIDRPLYRTITLRTITCALAVTAITLALAVPYAYLLSRTGSAVLRKLLLLTLFLPFFLGQVVRAYGWLVVLGEGGVLNGVLDAMGLPRIRLLFTFEGVVVGLVQLLLPFAVLLILPAMVAVGRELELASGSLGAPPWRTWRHVVLPLARPGLVAAGVTVFTLALTDFATAEILGGGSNDLLANAVYDAVFQLGDLGSGAALAILLTLLGSMIAGVALATLSRGVAGPGAGR